MEIITDDMMIADIQRIAHILYTNTISLNEYLENGGKYSAVVIDDAECGGFANKCELGGLKAKIDWQIEICPSLLIMLYT